MEKNIIRKYLVSMMQNRSPATIKRYEATRILFTFKCFLQTWVLWVLGVTKRKTQAGHTILNENITF
jgi:hypothetical protein